MTGTGPLSVAMLVFPGMTQLDFTAPHDALKATGQTQPHLVWKTRDLIVSDSGLVFMPTMTLAECPPVDIVFVPGGPGLNALLDDAETVAFLRRQGAAARWITSVCVGSLLLGAAGLLTGYRAGCHWASRDLLSLLGAIPDPARVVVDRNRVTGGGVTAGLDFALTLLALVRGADAAKRFTLGTEYDPQPPFPGGRPETAEPAVLAAVQQAMGPMLATRRAAVERAAARLATS